MLKQKVIILLIGLMSFSSVSGFFMLICHGSDGHIAVEFVTHKHCECPVSGDQGEFYGHVFESCSGHNDCVDALPWSNFIVDSRKNLKLSTDEVFTANGCGKVTSIYSTAFSGYLAILSLKLSSFFEPLRTVVLLA